MSNIEEEQVSVYRPRDNTRLFETPSGNTSDEEYIDLAEEQAPQEEELSDEPQEEVQREERKKGRKSDSLRRRFDDLTHQNRVKEALLAQERAEKQHILAQHQELQERLAQQESYTNQYYENALESEEMAVRNALRIAKEESDIDRDVDLTDRLADIKAKRHVQNYNKAQAQKIQHNQNYYDNSNLPQYEDNNQYGQMPYQAPAPVENEALLDFYDEHPYADPSNTQHYNPSLRKEIDEIEDYIQKNLIISGQINNVDPRDYYRTVSNVIRSKYGAVDDQEEEQYEQPVKTNTRSNVAPVGRSGATQADQYASRNPNTTRGAVKMTREELDIARAMAGTVPLSTGGFATEAQTIEMMRSFKQNGAPKLFKAPDWRR